MVNKLSDAKESKLFKLYFHGYSQTEVANKLGITQAAVSKHVGKFKTLAGQQGIMAAAEEYGVMDEVQALYELAADLKEAKKTVVEAERGLKVALVLEECDVDEEEYGDFIKTCEKLKNENYLFAAVELSQLEDSHGTSFEEIIAEGNNASKQLAQAQKELQDVHGKINSSNNELASAKKQKQFADQDLKAYMDQVGVDMHRLKMVETLALALKEAHVPDQELPHYIERQQSLIKAGISINLLTMIIEKANVLTCQDHGKKLLSLISEYGNLADTIKASQLQIKSLTNQTEDLEQRAAVKGKIEIDITKLKAERASLEPQVDDLQAQYQAMILVQNTIAVLEPERTALEQQIGALKTRVEGLNNDVEIKEKNVADLGQLETQRVNLLEEIAGLQTKVEYDRKRWKTYQGFLGLVHAVSKDELLKSARTIPALIELLPNNATIKAIKLYQNTVLEDLTGGKLPIFLRCLTCGAGIVTDKSKPNGDYQCPFAEPLFGSKHVVIVEKDSLAMLKQVLPPEKPTLMINVKPIPIIDRQKSPTVIKNRIELQKP